MNFGAYIFYATFLYANIFVNEQKNLWNEIKNLSTSVSHKEWLLLGEFNKAIKSNKRFVQIYEDEGPSNFRHTLKVARLHELRTLGGYFTWLYKSRNEDRKESKIDSLHKSKVVEDLTPITMPNIFRRL